MRYTDEQIENYLQILQTLPSSRGVLGGGTPPNRRVRCRYCGCDRFWREMGYNWCEKCYMSNGHVLGYYDQKEYERFHFRQRSIYQRKYYYEKRLQISLISLG